MCGIFCSVSRHEHIEPSDGVKKLLLARGPDSSSITHLRSADTFLTCHSTVLSLRGSKTITQPFASPETNCTLCWNGEAWGISGEQPDGSDTTRIFEVLQTATSRTSEGSTLTESASAVAMALSVVAGPYAFVFHDAPHSRLYFGRDFLGRRSLLKGVDARGNVLLSSVADGSNTENWSEVEADGVYCIGLTNASDRGLNDNDNDVECLGDFGIVKVPYRHIESQSDCTQSVGAYHGTVSFLAHGKVIPKLSLNRDLCTERIPLSTSAPSVLKLESLLRQSVSLRVLEIPEPPRHMTDTGNQYRAKLAILFSGGLDCTTLARLCHDLLPLPEPIDLLNAAFENPRVHKTAGDGAFELCPDRITGRASHAELCSVCPDREWRFIAVDIPYTETQAHRQGVLDLMYPHNTEMDLSIAFALYFAARGVGRLTQKTGRDDAEYVSSARVLLSGLGADELFAGYTRHATAFRRSGFTGLLDELDIDIARLGKRNLGRDDRVISNWGKEARFPFLDEKLVEWALTASVGEKCGFGEFSTDDANENEDGDCAGIEPGKKVLRCLAWKLGMKKVAIEKKRAIQFGARTAKMEVGKTKAKGTQVLT